MGKKNYEGDLYVKGRKVVTEDQIPQVEPNRSNIVIIPKAESDVYDYIEFENGKDMRIEGVVVEVTWDFPWNGGNGISEGFKCSLTFRTGDIYPFLNYSQDNFFFSGTHCQDDYFNPKLNYNYRIYFTYRDNMSVNGYVVGFPNEVGVDFIGELMHNAEKVSKNNSEDTLAKIHSIQEKCQLMINTGEQTDGQKLTSYTYLLGMPLDMNNPVTPEELEYLNSQYTLTKNINVVPNDSIYFEIGVESKYKIWLQFSVQVWRNGILEWDEQQPPILFDTNYGLPYKMFYIPIEYEAEEYIKTIQIYEINIITDQNPYENTRQIYELRQSLTEINSQIGDISTALDELHEYAQSLIAGG